MKIEIKASKDAAMIAELSKTVQDIHQRHYPEYFKTHNDKDVEKEIRKNLSSENWHSYIAYADDIPAGYALFYIRRYRENPFRHEYKGIHIDQICVTNKYQGMNIGTFLMNKIEEFAIDHKMDRIELTYWDKNIHAERFYRRNGFEEMMHFAVKRLR